MHVTPLKTAHVQIRPGVFLRFLSIAGEAIFSGGEIAGEGQFRMQMKHRRSTVIKSAAGRGENPPRVAGENHRSRWKFTSSPPNLVMPVNVCFMHKRIDLRVLCPILHCNV